jgi:hypothetical protein
MFHDLKKWWSRIAIVSFTGNCCNQNPNWRILCSRWTIATPLDWPHHPTLSPP